VLIVSRVLSQAFERLSLLDLAVLLKTATDSSIGEVVDVCGSENDTNTDGEEGKAALAQAPTPLLGEANGIGLKHEIDKTVYECHI
jgi:hypothetical protein